MRTLGAGLLAGLVALTSLPALEFALAGMAPKTRVSTAVRIGVNPVGQDTLITTVRWTLGDDGRGAVDSLKVNVTALAGGLLVVRPPVGTVSVTVQQGIPFGDGTWDVIGQVCSYRRTKASCANSGPVRVTVIDPPPPTPTGIAVTNVVKGTP